MASRIGLKAATALPRVARETAGLCLRQPIQTSVWTAARGTVRRPSRAPTRPSPPSSSSQPDERRGEGGVAAAAAFLERAVGLTADPARRAQRALAGAQAKHLAGAPPCRARTPRHSTGRTARRAPATPSTRQTPPSGSWDITHAGGTDGTLGVEARSRVLLSEGEAAERWPGEDFSSPDIGARLFISPKTVEDDLRKIFSKLGITSHTRLDRALAQPTDVALRV